MRPEGVEELVALADGNAQSRGYIGILNPAAFAPNGQAPDGVIQFADISGPALAREQCNRLLGDPLRPESLTADLSKKGFNQVSRAELVERNRGGINVTLPAPPNPSRT